MIKKYNNRKASDKNFDKGFDNNYRNKKMKQNSDRKNFKSEVKNENKQSFNDEIENLNLEGRNAVLEALNHDKTIDKILVRKDGIEGTLKVIAAKAREKGIVVQEVDKNKLDFICQSGNHQGVIAMCPAHEYVEVEDILNKAKEKNEPPFIIILDGITDPHNLGAIIRSADACGVHGVIIPKRRAVGLTGIVSKTSAGAIEHVLISRVSNLTNVIDSLKEKGIWVACAEFEGEYLYKSDLSGAIAIVIGAEGEGVSRLVKEKCDFNVKIPMLGKISSLNASVAAGVLMFEVVRRRHFVV